MPNILLDTEYVDRLKAENKKLREALQEIIRDAPEIEPEGYGDTSHFRWDGYTPEDQGYEERIEALWGVALIARKALEDK